MRGVNRKVLLSLIGAVVIAVIGLIVAKSKFKRSQEADVHR